MDISTHFRVLFVVILTTYHTSAVLQVFPNMHAPNGELQSSLINTALACLQQCAAKGRDQCVGFDFNNDQRQCYLHSRATECGPLRRKNSCVHYRFIDCSVQTTVAVTPAPTEPQTTPMSQSVPSILTIPSFPGLHIPDGVLIQSVNSRDLCYRLCYRSPTCQSFDWDFLNRRCFFHKQTTSCNTLESFPGSTHYRINANCNPVPFNCFNVIFVEENEASRRGGRRLTYNIKYDDCVALCRSRPGCQAVDWDIKDQACWEHTTAGIPMPNNCCKHARKFCNDGTTQAAPVTTTRVTTSTVVGPSTQPPMVTTPAVQVPDDGKCPAEILAVPNTRSDNGMDVAGVVDAEACKAWCLANIDCAAVDFDNTASSGIRCFYHPVNTYNRVDANTDVCCTQYRRLPACESKRCWNMPKQLVTSEQMVGGLTFYQPIDDLISLDPNMTYPDITLEECSGLCRIQTDFTADSNTGNINAFFPIQAERSCDTRGNPVVQSHKNCELVITDSDPASNRQNVSYTCYCSADQCNAFWSQVIQACIAHYPLDCHTLDLTFAQRHGEGFNMGFSGEDQAKNWSAVFNGSSFIQVNTFMNTLLAMVGPTLTNNIRPDFTLFFWFRFTDPQVTNMTIISNGPHGKASLDVMTSYINATHRAIHASVTIDRMTFTGTVAAMYNEWQYFSLRILPVSDYEVLLDVGDINQVTDSLSVDTGLSSLMTGASIDPTGNPLCIGKQYIPTNLQGFNIPGEFYVGMLDELWMFGRGLSDIELNSLVQASYYPVRMSP